jgi:hypothetical protein
MRLFHVRGRALGKVAKIAMAATIHRYSAATLAGARQTDAA